LEECQTLLAAAPARTFGKWGKKNGKATPKGQTANGKAANGAPADAAATRLKGKGAPIGLAAKAAKAAVTKKAPAKTPAKPPVKAAAAPKTMRKANPKAKKSSAKKKS
jgi:hypothetical protein